MEIKEIMNNITNFFEENLSPPHKITAVEKAEEGGFRATVEVIEEKEYMKRYAKDEMLGTYDVLLNEDKEVTSFKRLDIRFRSRVES